jgi:hypothetical protein
MFQKLLFNIWLPYFFHLDINFYTIINNLFVKYRRTGRISTEKVCGNMIAKYGQLGVKCHTKTKVISTENK